MQKCLLKRGVDQSELLRKDPAHLPGDLRDNTQQLILGPFHIVPLAGQVGIPFVDHLELLDGPHVHAAQTADLPFQLPDPPVGLCGGLQLDPLLHGGGVAQLVALPQLIQDLFLLHIAGIKPLLQPSGFPSGVQDLVVAVLQPLAHGGPLLFQRQLSVLQIPQTLLLLPGPQAQGCRCCRPDVDFPFRLRNGGLIALYPLQPRCPVAS